MPAAPEPYASDDSSASSNGGFKSDFLEPSHPVADMVQPRPSAPLVVEDATPDLQQRGKIAVPRPQNHGTVKRGLMGLLALGGGLAAFGLWGSSLSYRWLHVSTDYAVVNGRTVTVKAQASGTLQDVFARPGASVNVGQPLARIHPVADESERWVYASSPEELNLRYQAATLELAAKRQELSLFAQQSQILNAQASQLESLSAEEARLQEALANQERQQDILQLQQQHDVQQVAVEVASAKLSEAKAEASAAQQSYERYRQLWEQQIISRQKVDELKVDWEIAQGRIESSQVALAAAQRQADALQAQLQAIAATPLQSQPITEKIRQHQLEAGLQQQQQKLQQAYQTGQAQLPALQVEVESLKYQLAQAQALAQANPLVDLSAPFSGVIYQTRHDAGEQVERSDPLMTLLDCDDLWVEALISNQEAEQIDEFQPVSVYLKDRSAPVVGQVELMEPVSGLAVIQNREQRLLPALPHHMQQQALTRVTVRLDATEHVQAANRFCGVGQMASLSFRTERTQPKLALPNLALPNLAFLDRWLPDKSHQTDAETFMTGQEQS